MALPLLPIALTALSAIPEIQKLGLASKQRKQAEELSRIKQPKYEIADAETEALNRAKFNAMRTQVAGYKGITDRIGTGTQNQIRNITETAGSPAESINAASAAVGQGQDALVNLGIAGEQMYSQNQDKLTNQLTHYGGLQDKQWDLNQHQPYLRAKQAESALNYGSEANQYSGMKGIFGAASAELLYADQAGAFDSSGGKALPKKTPTTWNPSPVFPDASSQGTTFGQSQVSPEIIQIGLRKLRMSRPDLAGLSDEELMPMIQGQ